MLALCAVLDAKPDVFNHNVETIPRLVFARALTIVSFPVKRRMRSGRIDSKERLFRPAFQCVFC
jgi:hypothetical protein